jgi:hypothetical protein
LQETRRLIEKIISLQNQAFGACQKSYGKNEAQMLQIANQRHSPVCKMQYLSMAQSPFN